MPVLLHGALITCLYPLKKRGGGSHILDWMYARRGGGGHSDAYFVQQGGGDEL